MTDIPFTMEMGAPAPPAPGTPPVKPPWLRSVSLGGAIVAHALTGYLLITVPIPLIGTPEELTVDLDATDISDQEAQVEAAETPPPPEEVEDPEMAMEPPLIMSPDALPLPEKKKEVAERTPVERKQTPRQSQAQNQAHMRRSSSMSNSAFMGQLYASIKRHTPGMSPFGPGVVLVTFHVGPSGAIYGVSASGGSGNQSSLARRCVASTRGPPPPNGHFFGSIQIAFH